MSPSRILREIVTLAALSLGVALLLLPAFALGAGSANPFVWPPSAREAVGIMGFATFVMLGAADLLTGGALCSE